MWGRIGSYVALSLYSLFALTPLVWVFMTSLKPNHDAMSFPPQLIPRRATLENYAFILTDPGLVRSLVNSLVVVLTSAVLAVGVSGLAGYSFSRYTFPGKQLLSSLLLALFMIPIVMQVVPLYLMYQRLGLLDTLGGLVVAYQVLILPVNIFLLRHHFDTIPRELEEAACLDGATWVQVLTRITLPLAWPGLAAAAIIAFRFGWNEFVLPLTLTSSPEKMVFQVAIYRFLGLYRVDWGYLTAGITVGMVPVVSLLMFFQRQLTGGLTVGAGKW